MNKFVSGFLLGAILIFVACNNPDTQTTDASDSTGTKGSTLRAFADTTVRDICDSQVVAKYFVDEADAIDMITHFKQVFIRPGQAEENKRLAEQVWIDSCVIIALANYLTTKPDNFGVSIFNAAASTISTTTVLLVPSDNTPGHIPEYGAMIKLLSACHPKYDLIDLPAIKKREMMAHFNKANRGGQDENDYRKAIVDSLSMGMWLPKCVILSLAKLLQDNSNDLDGVRIHCAAYNQMDPGGHKIPGQFKANQSTFVLVVTKPDGSGGHEDNWNVIYSVLKNKGSGGKGYNHGDLCPASCTP